MWLSYDYLDLRQKNKSLSSYQLNICRVFNLDVQYPHAINTSMTIYMQGGTKYPK
jgi:hypothetical protein